MLTIMGISVAFFQSPNNHAIMNCSPENASIISFVIVTMLNLSMILRGSTAALILNTAISTQTLAKAQLFSLAAYNFSPGMERLMVFGMILSMLMVSLHPKIVIIHPLDFKISQNNKKLHLILIYRLILYILSKSIRINNI